jgi:polyphosphate kinase
MSEPAIAPTDIRTGRSPNLGHRTYYFNRELSWLEFNRRVLEEALDESNPLLERVKFLSIFSSNLDEFFMVRISGLRRQLMAGTVQPPPDGRTPAEQLEGIRSMLQPMLDELAKCWRKQLVPALENQGIRILRWDELKKAQREYLREQFQYEISPALTPLAFDPGHPFPHISNLSINLAVEIEDPVLGERFARVKVPHLFDRLHPLPATGQTAALQRLGLGGGQPVDFVWLEEVVTANLDLLFPGMHISGIHPFRVTRDADFEIEEDEAGDLMETMQEIIDRREFGSAVRLEVGADMPTRIREILMGKLELAPFQVFETDGPLGTSDLMQLASLDRPELKDPPFVPQPCKAFHEDDSPFSVLRERDILLYHPYDSFNPVLELIRQASRDPKVVAIKMTLYRVGPDSPIVAALREARENGIQVSALIELKARFDEANNIEWAQALEKAGVHVVYGLLGLKVHTKMCLIVRREADGMRRYVHLGTGNYNPVTAKIYTDLGLLSSDPDLGADVSDLFHALTGYSAKTDYEKILVSPHSMRKALLQRIDREIKVHRKEGGGRLIFKMNSLVDKACIKKLYKASQAGVQIDLNVRGICCLRPGVDRVSENIRVTSIVGRFLEHARAYYFRNGGDEEILVGSADLMPRNLNGRVELLFPVENERLKRAIRDDILLEQLEDNIRARRLLPDGSYERLRPQEGDKDRDCQAKRLSKRGSWHIED